MVPTATSPEALARQVVAAGFVHLEGPFGDAGEARAAAQDIARSAERQAPDGMAMPPLAAVGEFVIPPDGQPSRDFQLLHVDFGLPIGLEHPRDVARYTALHVPIDRPASHARTRVVSLAALLGQRTWPAPRGLLARLLAYGAGRGGRKAGGGYVEGILARLVEAADEAEPSLPPASECLCGQELESLAAERRHFAARGLCVDDVEVLVDLQPGELLVLDNLATAHGRQGARRPKELHQLMLGYPQLAVALQAELRDRVLAAFSPRSRRGFARGDP